MNAELKIELTEEQYRNLRLALIAAQCELNERLADLGATGQHDLGNLTNDRLRRINEAYENASPEKVKYIW